MALAPDPIHTPGRTTDLRAAGPIDGALLLVGPMVDRDPRARRAVAAAGTGSTGGPVAAAGTGSTAGSTLVRGVERRAARQQALLGGRPATPAAVHVRPGDEDDRTILAALADRDGGRRVPAMPVLIAEVDGIAVAAIGVLDRRVVVDPAGGATGAVALHAAVDRLQAVAAERRGPERRRRVAARVRRATGRDADGADRATIGAAG